MRAEGNTVRAGKNAVHMPAGTSATPRLTPPAGGQAPAEARISSDSESLLPCDDARRRVGQSCPRLGLGGRGPVKDSFSHQVRAARLGVPRPEPEH